MLPIPPIKGTRKLLWGEGLDGPWRNQNLRHLQPRLSCWPADSEYHLLARRQAGRGGPQRGAKEVSGDGGMGWWELKGFPPSLII